MRCYLVALKVSRATPAIVIRTALSVFCVSIVRFGHFFSTLHAPTQNQTAKDPWSLLTVHLYTYYYMYSIQEYLKCSLVRSQKVLLEDSSPNRAWNETLEGNKTDVGKKTLKGIFF